MKMIKYKLILICCVFFLACKQHEIASIKNITAKRDFVNYRDYTLATLINNARKFQNTPVRTIGYLHLEFEGNCLYLDKNDYSKKNFSNALFVGIRTRSAMDSLKKFSNHYVVITGVMDTFKYDLYSGSIQKIDNIKLYPVNSKNPLNPGSSL